MQSELQRFSIGEETAHFAKAVPCHDHAFDEALLCSCGVSWWNHQRLPEQCPVNARGRNRGEGAVHLRSRLIGGNVDAPARELQSDSQRDAARR